MTNEISEESSNTPKITPEQIEKFRKAFVDHGFDEYHAEAYAGISSFDLRGWREDNGKYVYDEELRGREMNPGIIYEWMIIRDRPVLEAERKQAKLKVEAAIAKAEQDPDMTE
ncbi:hypothetical protein KKF05_05805 [Patescibacteria group bacterium]|nr:hypothetical protein [Patescibacteria group bacterium]